MCHELHSLVIQSQSLILIEESMTDNFTLEFRLLVLQQLPVKQPLLANPTHRDGWRTGEAAATVAA